MALLNLIQIIALHIRKNRPHFQKHNSRIRHLCMRPPGGLPLQLLHSFLIYIIVTAVIQPYLLQHCQSFLCRFLYCVQQFSRYLVFPVNSSLRGSPSARRVPFSPQPVPAIPVFPQVCCGPLPVIPASYGYFPYPSQFQSPP